MIVEPPPCCGRPQVKTDCQAPHCLAYRCPTCGVGCDLNIPDGMCETVLRWSGEWSDEQAAAIADLIGIGGCIRLMTEWRRDMISVARSVENAQAALAEVLA